MNVQLLTIDAVLLLHVPTHWDLFFVDAILAMMEMVSIAQVGK